MTGSQQSFSSSPEDFLAENGFVVAARIDRAELMASFLSEMEKGLKGESSSLRMIPTYVGVNGRAPEGVRAAVLDAGGTNFRSALVSIPPKIENRRNQPMPGSKGEVVAEEFYAAFAAELGRVASGATAKRFGWCFSYDADSTPALDMRLNSWSKGIRAPEIVGQYVGAELMKRTGGGEIAVVNDTVATLLAAKAVEDGHPYSSYIGFILGTGTNTAYVERQGNIAKLSGLDPAGTMIINAESGNFGLYPQSAFDRAMDAKTVDPGEGLFEKMIAGAYLGPVALEIFKAAVNAGFFTRSAAEQLVSLETLSSIDLNRFCSESGSRPACPSPLLDIFADPADAALARRFALAVYERAAVLTAVHLAAFCVKCDAGSPGEAPIAISVDGSTYYKTTAISFAEIVRRELDDLLVARRGIRYEILPQLEDAPLIGAAIAALLSERKTV